MEKPSAISVHLNVVEVKCDVVDERILKVLKFLCAFNIHKLTNDTLHALYILKLDLIYSLHPKKIVPQMNVSSTKLVLELLYNIFSSSHVHLH